MDEEVMEMTEEEQTMEVSDEMPEEPTAPEAIEIPIPDPSAEIAMKIDELAEKLEKVYQTVQLFVAAGAGITDSAIDDFIEEPCEDGECEFVDPDELDLAL